MDLQIKEYKKSGKFLFYNEMAAMLPKLKEEFPFLKIGNSQSLQQTLKDLEKAFKAFFKGNSGFPKFKKYGSNDSYRIPQHFKRKKGKIKLPKVGVVKCRGSFPSKKDKVKSITISTDCGKWFASLCVEFTPKLFKENF